MSVGYSHETLVKVVKTGDVETVKLLLEENSDLDFVDENGETENLYVILATLINRR